MYGPRLDENHDIIITGGQIEMITDIREAAAQAIRCRFLMFKGEWFLDLNEGVPYIQVLFEKGTTDTVIRRIIREVILSVKLVESVALVEFTRDPADRSLVVRYVVQIRGGATLRSEDFGPLRLSDS